MKSPTGIPGLDAILEGGLPPNKTTLISGGPGAGKTTLALQFLINGAQQYGEPGLLLSFEEAPDALAACAQAFCAANGRDDANITFLDGRPSVDAVESGPFDISGVLAILGEHIERRGVRRIVLDGLDTLFSSGLSIGINAIEFSRLIRYVEARPATVLVLLKADIIDSTQPIRVSTVEHLADAVIHLETHLYDGLLQRVLRVVKIRAAGFATGEHAFLISARGIDVSYAGLFKEPPMLSDERVSTGVAGLDEMQEGGLLRSTVTLISGLPGTAKSTLGAAFLAAGLARGERVMLVALDEPAEQLIHNARSVGIDLGAPATRDSFRALSLNVSAAIANEHFLVIERAVTDFTPTILVIDPLSALHKAGGQATAELIMERLTYLVKIRGITAIFTALTNAQMGELESTVSHISTIADTWIHLSYAARGGERNRTLTIVKSRGTAHSNQMRELELSSSGVSLSEVYQFAGDVLLGTARVAQEQRDVRERHDRRERTERVLRDLETERYAAEMRMRDAESQRHALSERIELVRMESSASDERGRADRTRLVESRSAEISDAPHG